MSTFSSFLPSKLLNINNRDRSSDPLSRLRFALETMPGSRKYEFTPLTRTEIITELYDAFWGTHASHFVSNPSANLPLHTSLHELQQRQVLVGLGRRGNLSQVEHVATSSGKANVVSGVGKSPHRPRSITLTLIHSQFQGLRVGRQLCPLLAVLPRYKPCGPQRQLLHCSTVRGLL
jgi:hypothetical protein